MLSQNVKHRMINSAMLAVSTIAALGALTASRAHAQKNINFTTSGSVASTMLFGNQISPDVYSFFASSGEDIRLQTSNSSFDTTIRVIGPDASFNLFDDDGGGSLTSRLAFTTADTGTYIVVVSSYSGNPNSSNNGNYTLSFARGAAARQRRQLTGDPDPGESMSDADNPLEEKPAN
jgi:hypothetical protein